MNIMSGDRCSHKLKYLKQYSQCKDQINMNLQAVQLDHLHSEYLEVHANVQRAVKRVLMCSLSLSLSVLLEKSF